jgi:hypothetical protein
MTYRVREISIKKSIPYGENQDANSQWEFGVRHGIEGLCSSHSVDHCETNAGENVHEGD